MPSTLAHPSGVHERIPSKHFLCHDTDEISHTFLTSVRLNFHRKVFLTLFGYEFSDLTVLRIEQETRFVPDYEVVSIAEFFHVSCEYLLGVKNEK